MGREHEQPPGEEPKKDEDADKGLPEELRDLEHPYDLFNFLFRQVREQGLERTSWDPDSDLEDTKPSSPIDDKSVSED